jgi:hypothetical protein
LLSYIRVRLVLLLEARRAFRAALLGQHDCLARGEAQGDELLTEDRFFWHNPGSVQKSKPILDAKCVPSSFGDGGAAAAGVSFCPSAVRSTGQKNWLYVNRSEVPEANCSWAG